MKSSDNKKLTYIVVAMCFMLLVFGVSIGYNLTRNNRNYSGIDEPKLGENTLTCSEWSEYGSPKVVGTGVCVVGTNCVSSFGSLPGPSSKTGYTRYYVYSETYNGSTCTDDYEINGSPCYKVQEYHRTCSITSCDAGSYLSGGSCVTCPSGYTSSSGSTSINQCYKTVEAGQYLQFTGGTDTTGTCTGNTYYSSSRTVYYGSSSLCIACDSGMEANSSHTGCSASSTSSVTGISINECSSGSTTMVVGETKSFSTTITPSDATNKAVRWSTSADEDQLSILETGSVTAISVGGPYTITATARDGSGKTATCNITVSNPATYVESVTLNKSSITLAVGESTTVTATVLPSNASNKTISWSSGSVAIARVSNGTITGVAPGTTTITARATDGSNKSASVNVTVVAPIINSINGNDIIAITPNYPENDKRGTVDGLYGAKDTDNANISVTWSATGSGATFTCPKGTSCTVNYKHQGTASGDNYKYTTATVTATDDLGNTKNYPIKVYSYCSWTKVDENKEFTSSSDIGKTRDAMQYITGCYAYDGAYQKDGKTYYTNKYNRCCGTSGGGTTTKTSACYANAATIEEATQAEWLTEATSTLKYKLSDVTEGNCLPYACYGNASTIENSTNVGWYNYQPSGYYKLSASRSSCVKVEEACYGNGQTIATSTHVVWTSTKPNGYYKLSGVDKTSCVINTEPSLCYMNTSTGEYVWGKYQTTLGYEFVPAVTVEDYCEKPAPELNFACYKDSNGLYYWGDYSGDSGYTLISGITDSTKCGDPQEDACYKNGNEYVWGTYANVTGYELVTSINSASLCQNEACYKNNTSGNYEWGKHANDDNYTLVSNLTNKDACNNDIDVPLTAANVETIIYVGIAVLVMAGLTFMYYAFNNKHEY